MRCATMTPSTGCTSRPLAHVEEYEGGRHRFAGEVKLETTGPFGYTVRMLSAATTCWPPPAGRWGSWSGPTRPLPSTPPDRWRLTDVVPVRGSAPPEWHETRGA